ncbi:MAG: DnaJ domain-containing protein [Bacteroidales bacterium]|nr:DnaJ domain-containing protein [Bacteroidales bacterium]
MTKYYRALGLQPGAQIDDIKKAYRRCARKYHPDINKSPSASELFIISTEAYQFLLAHHKRKESDSDRASEFINEWDRYKREQARRKAYAHARIRYTQFVNSDLYKSTRVLDKTRIFIAIIFALLIIILAINGYIVRLKMVDKGFERPTLSGFILLIFTGILFLVTSLIFLYHHYKNKK